ncbi:MAG: four helix bundle protein [Patescibacteria group bacterium]
MTDKKFDLEERTAKFGIMVLDFCRKIAENSITRPLISQLVRSGTSVGANYCEANNAESKKDFVHKIGICKKEVRESMYWFHMIGASVPESKESARKLWQEAKELNLIFAKIIKSSRENKINDH